MEMRKLFPVSSPETPMYPISAETTSNGSTNLGQARFSKIRNNSGCFGIRLFDFTGTGRNERP